MIKLPSDLDKNNLINDLRIISWEVSDTLLYYSRIIKDSNNKINILKNSNKKDPVTLADLKVNEIIIKRINEKYKDIGWEILSEENVKISTKKCNINADWLWVIDPLDGTKDFIQGTSNYAMHLALNYQKKPYIGVVLIPEKDELWISDGEKTWYERREKKNVNSYFSISKSKSLKEMVIVTSKNHRNNVLKKIIDKLDFKDVIIMGSIGCKIASILRGESDIYYEDLQDEDRFRWVEYHKWKLKAEWYTPLTQSAGENPRSLVLRTHMGIGLIGQYNRAVGLSPFERFYLGGVFLSGFVLDGREIVNLRGFDDLSLTEPNRDTGAPVIAKYGAEIRYPLSTNPKKS